MYCTYIDTCITSHYLTIIYYNISISVSDVITFYYINIRIISINIISTSTSHPDRRSHHMVDEIASHHIRYVTLHCMTLLRFTSLRFAHLHTHTFKVHMVLLRSILFQSISIFLTLELECKRLLCAWTISALRQVLTSENHGMYRL